MQFSINYNLNSRVFQEGLISKALAPRCESRLGRHFLKISFLSFINCFFFGHYQIDIKCSANFIQGNQFSGSFFLIMMRIRDLSFKIWILIQFMNYFYILLISFNKHKFPNILWVISEFFSAEIWCTLNKYFQWVVIYVLLAQKYAFKGQKKKFYTVLV